MFKRRKFLSTVAVVSIAGCGSRSQNNTPENSTERYQNLNGSAIYTGSEFDRKLPKSVTVVESPDCAEIILLSSQTTETGDQVIQWLRSDIAVAVTGRKSTDNLQRLLSEGDASSYFSGDIVLNDGDYVITAADANESSSSLAILQSNGDFIPALDDIMGGIKNSDDKATECEIENN